VAAICRTPAGFGAGDRHILIVILTQAA
jgi:hypothetical protein